MNKVYLLVVEDVVEGNSDITIRVFKDYKLAHKVFVEEYTKAEKDYEGGDYEKEVSQDYFEIYAKGEYSYYHTNIWVEEEEIE